MSSTVPETEKLPAVNEADKTWRVIGGRASPEHRQVIDMAAAKLGQRRSHFMIEAAIEKALHILGSGAAQSVCWTIGRPMGGSR